MLVTQWNCNYQKQLQNSQDTATTIYTQISNNVFRNSLPEMIDNLSSWQESWTMYHLCTCKQDLSEHLENTNSYCMIPNAIVDLELKQQRSNFFANYEKYHTDIKQWQNKHIFLVHLTSQHWIPTESLSSIVLIKYTSLAQQKCNPLSAASTPYPNLF
jgi:hypothetical protein